MVRIVMVAAALGMSVGASGPPPMQSPWISRSAPHPARLGTCKSVYSCEEAVALWCGGYRGADRDRDGIPCENVCSSRDEVDEIRARIGC